MSDKQKTEFSLEILSGIYMFFDEYNVLMAENLEPEIVLFSENLSLIRHCFPITPRWTISAKNWPIFSSRGALLSHVEPT